MRQTTELKQPINVEKPTELLEEYLPVADNVVLAYMVKSFGQGLEKLNQEHKMFLVYQMLDDLAISWGEVEEFPDEIYQISNYLRDLKTSDQVSLIKFLTQTL